MQRATRSQCTTSPRSAPRRCVAACACAQLCAWRAGGFEAGCGVRACNCCLQHPPRMPAHPHFHICGSWPCAAWPLHFHGPPGCLASLSGTRARVRTCGPLALCTQVAGQAPGSKVDSSRMTSSNTRSSNFALTHSKIDPFDDVKLGQLLGTGSFGRVYRGGRAWEHCLLGSGLAQRTAYH